MIIGFIFLVMGFLVGVKKFTWLLAGYNEKRVKDKGKLARLVGGTFALIGAVLLICGIVGVQQLEMLVMGAVVIIIMEVVYVNARLVE